MQTIDAVKTRILRLCEQKLQSKTVDDKNDMRRAGYDACGVFLLAGV